MAERKLNINAPLMSVRRSSATPPSLIEAKKKILEKRASLPYYKSDMTLDQVTEPVAVPFNWEHIPGRRKGNGRSEPLPTKGTSMTPSPRLPPGKSTNATKQPVEKESKAANRFKSSNKSKSFSVSVVKIDCDRERKTEKIVERRLSNVEYDKDNDDDVYSDALETLSPTESFSMNCSVSGVSGLDNLDANKSGNFSTDQQTRDFMMSRFLPAAKAMTLQPSQYSSKKQSVLVEQQPRDLSKLVREEKRPLINKHFTDIIPYTAQCQEKESEDEGDDYDYGYDDNSANISAKGCGLLPQLHIRNSLCLLNPVAGMKMKNQGPLSSGSEVGKPNKISHIRSFSPVPAVKKAWEAIHKNKSSSGAGSPDMQEGRKKWTSDSNRFTYSGELLPGRLSPFRRSRAAAAGISPCRSKPQSPFRGTKLLGDSKEAENYKFGKVKFYSGALGNIQDVISQGARRTSYSGNLTFEKTLYIDTAGTVKLSSSNLNSVDNKRRVDTVAVGLDRRNGKENSSSLESSQDIKHVQAVEEKDTIDSEVSSSMDSNQPTLYSILNLTDKDKDEGLTTDQNPNQEPMSLPLMQGTFAEDSKIDTQQIVLASGSGKGRAESAVSPLPPPLPKSPSESWLWRALPKVSVKNSFLHSNQATQSQAKRHDSNTTSGNIKWETIVKTSNLHHDHVRYSQELPTYKSQHSKS
ncbi:hypothetical protein VNO77_44480 [Canavalia gladiata]|uniref:Uncharacterized protein n=1 Tax=Canavalia gladiata TaxID=3824 RepID=A0AAN9JX47_CANGL